MTTDNAKEDTPMSFTTDNPDSTYHAIRDEIKIHPDLPYATRVEMGNIMCNYIETYHDAIDVVQENPHYQAAHELGGEMYIKAKESSWAKEDAELRLLVTRPDLVAMRTKMKRLSLTPRVTTSNPDAYHQKDKPILSTGAKISLASIVAVVLGISYAM